MDHFDENLVIVQILVVFTLVPALGGLLLLALHWQASAMDDITRDRGRWLLMPVGVLLMVLACFFASRPLLVVVIAIKNGSYLGGHLGLIAMLSTLVVGMLSVWVCGVAGVRAIRLASPDRADSVDEAAQAQSHSARGEGLRLYAWLLVTFPIWIVFGGMLIFIVPFYFGLSLWAAGRDSRQTRLLWTLAIAVEHDLPIAEEVDAFAESLWGYGRRKALRFSDSLDRGASLAGALASHPGLVPLPAVTAIRMGEATGRLAPVLRELAQQQSASIRRTATGTSPFTAGLYVWFVLTIIACVMTFTMYFIIPTFKRIFSDFGVDLPPLTKQIIAASDGQLEWIPLLSLVMLLTAGAGVVSIVQWRNLNIPLLMRLFPRRDGPDVMRSLATAIAADQPLPPLLEELAALSPRRDLSERFDMMQTRIEEGRSIWEALWEQNFISKNESQALAAAAANDHLSWAMHALADSIDRTRNHRWLRRIELIKPLSVLLLALLVGLFTIGMFLPLIELLTELPIE